MTARLQWFGLARGQIRSALASGAGISPADPGRLPRVRGGPR